MDIITPVPKAWKGGPTSALALALALISGCSGVIGASQGGRTDGRPEGPATGTDGTGEPGTPGTPGTPEVGALCTASDEAARTGTAPSTRVRRLTKMQIQNSLAALLGQDVTAGLSGVDPDTQTNGNFTTSDELEVSGSFANSLNLAMDAIGIDTQFKSAITAATYGASCFSSDSGGEACAKTFIQTFGKKAFRRVITDTDVNGLMTVYTAGREVGIDGNYGDRFATGLTWVVKAIFQSPDLLYLTELGDPAAANGAVTTILPAELASAMSYSILAMPPDDALSAAADRGELSTPQEIAAQARRLIGEHPDNWKQQLGEFVIEWLGVNFTQPQWTKDPTLYPNYSPQLKDAIQTETTMLIQDWAIAADGPRLDGLLTSPSTFVNAISAPLYGAKSDSVTFQKTNLDPSQRAGILTFAGFLGTTSHADVTSPVLRGKVIMQKFLCRDPPPPPANVPPLPAVVKTAPTTTRARFESHLVAAACSGCHSAFQPMGNAFEEYDALGGYRTKENNFPVDSTGELVGATGGDVPVANGIELSKVLAKSPDTADCVARQVFRYAIGHLETDHDTCNISDASHSLLGGTWDVRDLLVSIVTSDSFRVRTVNVE